MRQTDYSRKLEEYAAALPGAYEAFVAAMWIPPQNHGVDREFWEWVSENQPTKDEMQLKCCLLTIPRRENS